MQLTSKILFVIAMYAIGISSAEAVTVTAIASGNWSSNSTWSCGCQPSNADNIVIPAGITVTSSGPAILFLGPVITITIYGTLVLNNASLQVDASDIIAIKAGGKIMATGITGGSIYSGVIPMFVGNGSSIVGPKIITNGTLPVTLIAFTGAYEEQRVVLQWTSASEVNSDHYEVSRAGDGSQFDVIASINSAGNSTQRIDYLFTDGEPLVKNFYRLTAVDLDGTRTVYKTIMIETDMTKDLQVYPNPVSEDRFFVKVNFTPSGDEKVSLYDCVGAKLVISHTIDQSLSAFVFDTPPQKGIYYLLLNTGSAVFKRRIIIQ